MVRKAEFTENDFILAAIDLIAHGGPAAATMNSIAASAGAPTGSLYHRFESRTALIGAAWLHALSSMSAAILPHLNRGNSGDTVTALIQWARDNAQFARLILLYAENDLINDALPPEQHKEINAANQKLGAGLSALINVNHKALTAGNLALANFAIFDGPIAAMKPYLRAKPSKNTLNINKCRKVALACCKASLELLE